MFKVGDIVKVINVDMDEGYLSYKRMIGKEGTISLIEEDEEFPIVVSFHASDYDDNDEDYYSEYLEDELGFAESELELV